jgi:adenylyl- and sulfurtransferase ThiI
MFSGRSVQNNFNYNISQTNFSDEKSGGGSGFRTLRFEIKKGYAFTVRCERTDDITPFTVQEVNNALGDLATISAN